MNQSQLKSVMKFHLKHFNDEGAAIDDDTVLQDVLSDSDGYGAANSSSIFKMLVRWTFKKNNHTDPAWPADWMGMSVKDLAARLLP